MSIPQDLGDDITIGHSGARRLNPLMARILAFSSHVAYGSVGLAAIVPALQWLGHEVIALPTVILSNHPGYGRFSGEQVSPVSLDQMLDSLEANGWLGEIDAVLTGYLPNPGHVATACSAVQRVRSTNPAALFYCDPVLGDDPKGLYIDSAAAEALRDELLPLSDLAVPNRFELAWLSGESVDSLKDAVCAGRKLPVPVTLATSIPVSSLSLGTVLVEEHRSTSCQVTWREGVGHGTGDLISALFLGHTLKGLSGAEALALTVAQVEATILASPRAGELSLAAAAAKWTRADPLAIEVL